jgi:ribose 5-phosphate isomerase B
MKDIKIIYIGSDHGGFELKEAIKKHFAGEVEFVDCGNAEFDADDNFPDFAQAVCERVLTDGNAFGILVCGTGIGVSIAANHYRGIRAALCHSADYARLSRQHNNANVLCLGGRFIEEAAAFEVVKTFLDTEADPNPKYKVRMDAADRGNA